ncbi:hypothetical protein, partial [Staphylococcus saprophyticus]|uniref:hypothetical protein n=1 Tax=Staphylococcus saprophyticus TaxID=29385 RepID=UPI001C92E1D4
NECESEDEKGESCNEDDVGCCEVNEEESDSGGKGCDDVKDEKECESENDKGESSNEDEVGSSDVKEEESDSDAKACDIGDENESASQDEKGS